jgi:spermidine/putrescine transport system permease protein
MRDRSSKVAGWLLMLPLAAWLVLFVVAPTAILLLYSFCQTNELGDVVWRFTLDNYRRALEPTYRMILFRSVVYAALTTVICLVVGYPVAYFIARSPPRWRHRLLLAVMIPFWTSFLIRTYAWLMLLGDSGLVNATLQTLHVISNPLNLLYTWKAVVLGLTYSYLPFMILPIYGSVEKLDGSLIEAALDLGASPLRAFARVILPLTMSGITAGVLIVFVPAIGMFAIVELMGGDRTPMIGNTIQRFFGPGNDWPFGSALGMVLMGMFFVTYLACAHFLPRNVGRVET